MTLVDWTDIGDIAALVSVIAALVAALFWFVRKIWRQVKHNAKDWVTGIVDDAVGDIKTHLINGDTSVAVYAHEARDAAKNVSDQMEQMSSRISDLRGDIRDLNHTMVDHIADQQIHAKRRIPWHFV